MGGRDQHTIQGTEQGAESQRDQDQFDRIQSREGLADDGAEHARQGQIGGDRQVDALGQQHHHLPHHQNGEDG